VSRPDVTLSRTDPRTRARAKQSTPTLVVALDAEHPLSSPSRHSLWGLDEVRLGRGAPGVRRHRDGRAEVLELSLSDRWMSVSHARLVRDLDRWVIEDCGSKNGVAVDGAPQQRAALAEGSVLELGRTFLIFTEQAHRPEPADLDAKLAPEAAAGFRTFDTELSQRLEALANVSASKVPVLIRGETGTGKELMARAVHQLSRRSGAFVAVNCATFTESLLTSELFGHKRGAFTGAGEDRPGLVRSAHQGTLFLDEVADLSAPGQAALLRTLQEGELVPVGASAPIKVDLRLVSATHGDLRGRIDDERFRADLFARLNGFELELPPLRDRRCDLGLLCGELLRRIAATGASRTSFAPEAARALLRYGWPLNVRELEQCLAAAVALSKGGRIELEHLPPPVRAPPAPRPLPWEGTEAKRRDELVALLAEHRGNVSAVARALGKGRTQIQRWMKRYRLP
jgi:DNA-binding NtrC family response regulator